MAGRTDYLNMFKQPGSGFKLLANYLSVLFLACLFSWQQSSATGNNAPQINLSQGSVTIILSNNTSNHANLPLQSTALPQVFESFDESEMEGLDDDDNVSIEFNTAERILGNLFQIIGFSEITGAIQNRSTVPLFVLYHSWKTYLS